MRFTLLFLFFSSFLYAYTSESGIVKFDEHIIDEEKFDFSAFEIDLNNINNDPYFSKNDIDTAHEKIIKGVSENRHGIGSMDIELYENRTIIGLTVYDLSSPVASDIYLRRRYKVFYSDYYFEFSLLLKNEYIEFITSNMGAYFGTIEEGKLLVWKNSSGFIEAWKKQECPPLLTEMDRLFYEVVDSMKFTFPSGYCNDSNVRIREKPDLESPIIGKLQKNDEVTIIDKTPYRMEIGNNNSKWFKIMTNDGLAGWSFGLYITEGAP